MHIRIPDRTHHSPDIGGKDVNVPEKFKSDPTVTETKIDHASSIVDGSVNMA